jgi:voltage-gated potassium channel Kch
MSLTDLALVSLPTSKSVVVLAPETHPDGSAMAPHESDTVVLKTLLAISKTAGGHPLHIVAELQAETTEAVARMVVGPDAALIVSPPLISRLLVQTGRQSGLSVVYTELLDFGGVEMYIQPQPELAGRTFRDAIFAYDTSTLLGVVAADGELLLPPAPDRVFQPGDQVIAISEDDDTIVLDGRPLQLHPAHVTPAQRQPVRHRERTLVLGASERLGLVLHELDAYVAPGSETLVVGEGRSIGELDGVVLELKQMTVDRRLGDVTDRTLLDDLGAADFDHILVLSETDGRSQEMADARTMITLLHLRDILQRSDKKVPITSEILQIENRDLAAVAEADDFIVSNTLVSLLISQVSENKHLVRVFGDLFTAGGYEIYLKPSSEYVPYGIDLPFQAVVESALQRGEVAIGVRRAATARDAGASYGVVVNPAKSAMMNLLPGDKVIVLADD